MEEVLYSYIAIIKLYYYNIKNMKIHYPTVVQLCFQRDDKAQIYIILVYVELLVFDNHSDNPLPILVDDSNTNIVSIKEGNTLIK